ncbi:MAG: hypothetical protein ACK44D_07235 [Bacteroidia bacterium]
MDQKLVYLLLAVAAIVVFMKVILPKLNLNMNQGKILRAILFLGMMIWLGIDFYLKEKYWYILFLVLGSVAFLMMLKDSRKK